ncbi:MAG: hypothetical protein V4507_10355 [Verrucomicrobiota bacterium]
MSIFPNPSQPDDIVPNAKELTILVGRLEKLITNYLLMAPKLQLQVRRNDIRTLLSHNLHLIDHPDFTQIWNETPLDYFLQGLYEELNLESSNIFTPITSPEGTPAFAPLSPEGWRQTLLALQKKF